MHVDMLEVVRERIERGHLLETDTTLVVGVSGGADSLCLLHVLNRLRSTFCWSLHVAHLNHRLRGAAADDDMRFVAETASSWGVPCTVQVADIQAAAQQGRCSVEETARQIRYAFLSDVAQKVGAAAVAVGHNADDQSETVLMHLLRGAGLDGLRGMRPVIEWAGGDETDQPPIRLVRPLLSVSRADIEEYCRAHDLRPRFDRSNLDTAYFRNRLRHELLPLLETYNPNIRAALRRTAEVVGADCELLAQVCDDAWSQITIHADKTRIFFDRSAWRALPLALQRATLRRAASGLRPGLRDLEFVQVEQAVEIASYGTTGAQAVLPQGLRLSVDYDTLRITRAGVPPAPPDWPLLREDAWLAVRYPGTTLLPPHGQERSQWCTEMNLWDGDRVIALANSDRWTAYLDADALGPGLALRTRRAGDRFLPLGMGGRSTLVADFMVNVKISRRWRAQLPLLVHGTDDHARNGEIAWVIGWRIDDRIKITPDTQRIIRARCRRV
jgi:tRNA(Ile)-lysidine synthase